jgi:hypothetical protein
MGSRPATRDYSTRGSQLQAITYDNDETATPAVRSTSTSCHVCAWACAVLLALVVGLTASSTQAYASSLSWSDPAFVDHPNALSGVALSGIDCPSTGLCVAVDDSGNVVTSTNPIGGASAWTVTKIDSYFMANNILEGISCPSTGLCVAVDINGNILTSTEPTGDASSWHLAHIEAASNVRKVSCPSAELCIVVDGAGDVISSTEPTGGATAWTTTRVDSNGSSGELSGISCPSTKLCVAVDRKGDVLTSTDPTGGAGAWTSAKIDSIEGDMTSLSFVSCHTESSCVAVDESGNVFTSADPAGGVSAWHSITTSFTNFGFDSVSCASATFCTAAGPEGTVLTSTNPTSGTGAWVPTDIDSNNVLTGVSCPSSDLCVAVDEPGNVLVGTAKDNMEEPKGKEEPKTGGGGGSGGGGATTTATTTTQLTTPSEPTPAPILGQRQTASVISGAVTVRLKGTTKFVPLSGTSSIPDGSEVEATNGRVLITVATLTPGKTQRAEVWGGRFLIHQEHTGSGETHFILSLPLTGCPRVALPRGSAAVVAAGAKHSSGPKSRHLWVSEGGGSWGTNGRYVSTSVEGTHWLTLDECDRSEVTVSAGKVKVHDLVRNRTKTITTGQHYTAAAKRHG